MTSAPPPPILEPAGAAGRPGGSLLQPRPHPLLPHFTLREVESLLARPGGAADYAAWYNRRQRRIDLAEWTENEPLATDPLRDGFELPHWKESDLLLGLSERTPAALAALPLNWELPYTETFTAELRAQVGRVPATVLELIVFILILLGGNRSGKSEYCAKRTVRSALRHANATIICLSEDLDASRENQQALIWKYLPRECKQLNGTRDARGIYHINYSKKGGFTLERVILPNGSTIHFKTYNQEPGAIEGWMLGSREFPGVVGAWADENLRVGWLKVLERRCKFCHALLLWSYTPVYGMTPAIKEAVGEAATLMSLPSELLPERINVPGLPPGQMPYIQKARMNGAVVQYFFTQFNPFGTGAGTFYDTVKELTAGKESGFVMRLAHGYTTDSSGRAFPMFSPANIVRVENLPETGTLYQLVDPHGTRNYACLWVLAAPGSPPTYYVVREWPDEPTYGEWAVPTARAVTPDARKGWDGDPGPAQRGQGWGISRYKQLWLTKERILVPATLRESHPEPLTDPPLNAERSTFNVERSPADSWRDVKYPWHRPPLRAALAAGELLPESLQEDVRQRWMDSRFAASQHATEHGGTCLQWQFDSLTVNPQTGQTLPRFYFTPAPGKDIAHGEQLITQLLEWKAEEPFVPHVNAPRLFVSEECTQTRWALENYTGLDADGACKEWIDLLRYLAEAAPGYVKPGPLVTQGGGSY